MEKRIDDARKGVVLALKSLTPTEGIGLLEMVKFTLEQMIWEEMKQ